MANNTVLVFGGTGLAGICILRELLYRNHSVIVFARNPSKIPDDLQSNPSLEVIKGELTDLDALSTAVAKSQVIISILGPTGLREPNIAQYTEFYRALFPLMRQHGVRRIFAMTTISVYRPEDERSLTRYFIVSAVSWIIPDAYRTMLAIGETFEKSSDTTDIDWTLYRIGIIQGNSDANSWEQDRKGEAYAGPVGKTGWSSVQKRAALARWLVDAAESSAPELIRKMPAVSQLASS